MPLALASVAIFTRVSPSLVVVVVHEDKDFLVAQSCARREVILDKLIAPSDRVSPGKFSPRDRFLDLESSLAHTHTNTGGYKLQGKPARHAG